MMFIPEVILPTAASSLGPGVARRWPPKRVLRAGMIANLLAMILLTSGRLFRAPREWHLGFCWLPLDAWASGQTLGQSRVL